MALKDILVHVDHTDQGLRRLDAAVGLAAAHNAHLIALYVVGELRISGYGMLQIPEEIERQHVAAVDAYSERARSTFEERLRFAGINGEWRRATGDLVRTIALHGRYVDIVIVGQRDPTGGSDVDELTVPDQLVLAVGRPVLVIPLPASFPSSASAFSSAGTRAGWRRGPSMMPCC